MERLVLSSELFEEISAKAQIIAQCNDQEYSAIILGRKGVGSALYEYQPFDAKKDANCLRSFILDLNNFCQQGMGIVGRIRHERSVKGIIYGENRHHAVTPTLGFFEQSWMFEHPRLAAIARVPIMTSVYKPTSDQVFFGGFTLKRSLVFSDISRAVMMQDSKQRPRSGNRPERGDLVLDPRFIFTPKNGLFIRPIELYQKHATGAVEKIRNIFEEVQGADMKTPFLYSTEEPIRPEDFSNTVE
jgi:hypothetical protein